MSRRVTLLLLVVFGLFLFLQCSGGGGVSKPRRAERTVQDVDRDLQAFKTAIRAEVATKNDFILVVGGFSAFINILLVGFVLYYRKKARLLAPQAAEKKEPAKKSASAKKSSEKKASRKKPQTEPTQKEGS